MRYAERRSMLGVVEGGREAYHEPRHHQGIRMGLLNLVAYIVDDDLSIRRALTRLLKSLGVGTVVFDSAEAFLQAGPSALEAFFLLVVHVPGMKGGDLREHWGAAGIALPVIIITAYNDAQTHDRAMQAGIVAYLQKPFDDQTLLEALRQAYA